MTTDGRHANNNISYSVSGLEIQEFYVKKLRNKLQLATVFDLMKSLNRFR